MKKKIMMFGVILAMLLGCMACGSQPVQNEVEEPKVTEAPASVEMTEAPEPTETPEAIETPAPTATLVPTEVPEITETSTPTAEPEPIEKPEATEVSEPAEKPEATVTLAPTATPEPTAVATLVPTVTSEPTATPIPTVNLKPTATPIPAVTLKPIATPVPTPKPGTEVTIKFFTPLVLKDLREIKASDALEFMNNLSEYAWDKEGNATEAAMLNETVSDYLNSAEKSLMATGDVQKSAEVFFGDEVRVSGNGWYDLNRTALYQAKDTSGVPRTIVENGKEVPLMEERSVFYSSFNQKSFSDYEVEKGETLEVVSAYTVQTGAGATAYAPCILDVQLNVGFLKMKMTYMMAMPVSERITLPELEGYSLEWVDDGTLLNPETVRIMPQKINRYTLIVKPK